MSKSLGYVTAVDQENGVFYAFFQDSIVEVDMLKCLEMGIMVEKDVYSVREGIFITRFNEKIEFCKREWTRAEIDAAKEHGKKFIELVKSNKSFH